MKRITLFDLSKDFSKFGGESVKVSGWVRTVRDSKVFGFIELSDGTCFKCVQIVFESNVVANFDEVTKLNVGAAITVEGKLVLTPENKQPYEIKATEIVVNGNSTPDYPLQKKRHSLEYLREIAYLRPRTNTFNAVFKIRSECAFAIHNFYHSRNFIYVHTPIVTGSDCEGAGEMFKVTTLDLNNIPKENGKIDFKQDFFEKESNLTVSGQLNAEAFALAFSNVYTFGPTFRAEKSNTSRHAAEFWMIEPEIAFADLKDDMNLAEDMVKFIIAHIFSTCKDELEFLNSFVDKGLIERLNKVASSDFGVVTYTEAIEILEKAIKEKSDLFEYPVFWGCDLQSEHERYITEKVFNKPVFLINYPKEIKAFYMRLNDDNKTVAAMDLLVPGIGELVGGSQREERLEMLEARLDELKLDKESYWWYLNLRKYGGTKHAGFGLGFERLVMYVTGVSNIRDVLPFPRTTGSLEY